MRRFSLLFLFVVFVSVLQAQRPCRDTTVHFADSICEGNTYEWGGRTLDHTGVYYDTLQRVGTTCDSVSVLHLFVLQEIYIDYILVPKCHHETGYELFVGAQGRYVTWYSDPPDPHFRYIQPYRLVYINPSVPTVYTTIVDYSATPSCPQQSSITVNPIQTVQADLYYSPTVLDNDHTELTLHDGSRGNHNAPYGGWAGRNWYINGERLATQAPDLKLTLPYPYPDTVSVLMESFTPTCLDSAMAIIPFNKRQVYIPNVFTPDAESDNLFLPVIQNLADYHLYIYNRQGHLLFDTPDPTLPWDGTAKGTPCPQGVYNYRLRYSHSHSPTEFFTLTGTVLLLR